MARAADFIERIASDHLTARDQFAKCAMAAMLTHNVGNDWPEHKNVAMQAYDMADKMLRARGAA
ncbi:MAG: hypothetical protein VB138_14240 [Burkholderia sp.]